MEFFKRVLVMSSFAGLLPVSLFVAGHIYSDARRAAPSGTFQVICEKPLKSVFSEQYMDSLRLAIEEKRDPEKIVFIDLDKGARVMILPARQVESRTFRPVAEFIDGSVKRIR
jgi:hypothetical protein